jgi:hypothetical protein
MLSDEEKKQYIESIGWITWYNEDNWIHTTIMAGANWDYCGLNLNEAYECTLKHPEFKPKKEIKI